jgi:hypothetical protein
MQIPASGNQRLKPQSSIFRFCDFNQRNLVSKQFFNFKFNQEIDEETLSLKPLLPDNAKT